MTTLPDGMARVAAALEAAGIRDRIRVFEVPTKSSADAAAAIGCAVAEIAKTLVFRGIDGDRPVIAVVSGAARVDEAKLAALLGSPIGRADAAFVRARTGYVIGGVSPVDLPKDAVIFLDRALIALGRFWAAAGAPNAVFALSAEELVALTNGEVGDVVAA